MYADTALAYRNPAPGLEPSTRATQLASVPELTSIVRALEQTAGRTGSAAAQQTRRHGAGVHVDLIRLAAHPMYVLQSIMSTGRSVGSAQVDGVGSIYSV